MPLIKFIDSSTNIHVDICFGVQTGVKNSNFVKKLLVKYPTAKPIFIVVKYLLQVLGLNEVYTGGLGSYAILLMIVGFLQQKNEKSKVSSFGDLLISFFLYYGVEFPYYSKGISIEGEGKLFSKEERGWLDMNQPHMLSIEDPNNSSNVSFLLIYFAYQTKICFRMLLGHHGIFSKFKLCSAIVIKY